VRLLLKKDIASKKRRERGVKRFVVEGSVGFIKGGSEERKN